MSSSSSSIAAIDSFNEKLLGLEEELLNLSEIFHSDEYDRGHDISVKIELILSKIVETNFEERVKLFQKIFATDRICEDPSLASVLKRINYLTKHRYFSSLRSGLVFNTKFSHHLSKRIWDFEKMTLGGAFVLSGIATLVFKGFGVESDENSSKFDWTAISVGSLMVLAPIFDAFNAARKDDC